MAGKTSEVGEGRKESRRKARPCSPAAIRRSRRATATPPCRPTSRPCRAGNATSGAASTRSSCAPSPACARPSNGTRRSMASRTRAGSSAFTASRSTSKWLSSAARRCALSRPASPSSKDSALPRHPRGRPARRSAARRLGEAGQPIARRTNVSGATTAMKKATQHEEERRERSKRRRLSLPADRCEDQGAGRLARRDARADPKHHQAGRPRRGRGVEVARAFRCGSTTASSAPARPTRRS